MSSGAEIGLVDNNQHLYILIFDRAFAAPNCPTNYWWTETEDSRVRVASGVSKNSDKKEQFAELTEEEVLPTTSTDSQLDYAFYKIVKAVEALMERCLNIKTWRDGIGTDVITRAQQVILAGETSLYSLKCRQLKVQLATDWDTQTCFKELPVWVDADKPHQSLRFLVPGSRLLLNSSQPESCLTDSKLPPGYQTTEGEWVALNPQLHILMSPRE